MSLSSHRRTELLARPYIRLLASHEVAISHLYNSFGNTLPQNTVFWRQLAKEELEHRDIVIEIEEKLDKGEYKFAIPQFHYAALEKSMEWIKIVRQRMEQEGITMNTAFGIALTVEKGMLESDFFSFLDENVPEAKTLCDSLTKYTEAHLKRVEDEAHKFKWKVMGNKLYLPDLSSDEWEPCEDPAVKIKLAQAAILDRLILLEEAASRLYNTYDRLLSEPPNFWGKLAAEEMQHANMLRNLHASLEKGKLLYNLGMFDKQELTREIEYAMDRESEARAVDLSVQDALNNALTIEKSMAEGSFYQTVHSDDEQYQIIAKRLIELTKVHMEKLKMELKKSLMGPGNTTQGPA